MDQTTRERLQWAVLTMIGLIAGIALALPLGVPIFAVLGAMAGTPVVLSIVGLGVGGAQWPIVRKHMPASGWWVVASVLGMAVGLTAGVVLVEQIGRALSGGPLNFRMLGTAARAASFGTIGIIAGAALGLGQSLVARLKAKASRNWILVNGTSLGAGLAFGSLLADAFIARAGSAAGVAILLAVGSGVAGACSASALAGIFPSSTSVAGR